jgi:hypothetical protein
VNGWANIEIKKIKVAQPAMVAWCELEPLVATKGLEGGASATYGWLRYSTGEFSLS